MFGGKPVQGVDRHPPPAPPQASGDLQKPKKDAARPPPSKAELLHEALCKLPPGDTLYLTTDGSLGNKGALLLNPDTILVSFTRRESGWGLYRGLPNENVSLTDPIRGEEHRITGAVELSKDQPVTFFVGDARFTLRINRWGNPVFAGTRKEEYAEILQSWAKRIYRAKPNAPVTIGRNVGDRLPPSVSRSLFTVIKEPGRAPLSWLIGGPKMTLHPGLPSTAALDPAMEPRIHLGDEDLPIRGMTEAPDGATLSLGTDLGTTTLPPIKLDSKAIAARKLLEPYTGKQPTDIPTSPPELNASPADALELHIRKGLALIKAGRYDDAIILFSNDEPLRALNYRQEITEWRLDILSARGVCEMLPTIAMDCWHKGDQQLVEVPRARVSIQAQPRNEDERILADRFQEGVTLLWAEELIHALQYIRGRTVSRWAPVFTNKVDNEGDVALFLLENGISLTGEFISRHCGRAEALQLAAGSQTSEQETRFQEIFGTLKASDTIVIHRLSPHIIMSRENYTSDSKHSISECAVAFNVRGNGEYEVKPGGSKVFSPGKDGRYQSVPPSGTLLLPGTPIFIGSDKFVLPIPKAIGEEWARWTK